jgi:hypothetical protein
MTTGAKYNISATGVYDGNQTITVVDGTHLKIATAFAGNATGNLAGAAIIDTMAHLLAIIDARNQTIVPPTYLSVTSGVNYQMANTPPLVFNFNPTTNGIALQLPQMNIPGALPKGRRLLVFNTGISCSVQDFSGATIITLLEGPGGVIEFELIDNTTQVGQLKIVRILQNFHNSFGDTNATLIDGWAPISVSSTSANLTAPRTWTLPAASAFLPGTFQLIVDGAGGVSSTNTLMIAVPGGSGGSSTVLNRAHDFVLYERDTSSNRWNIVGGKGALASTDLSDFPIPPSSGGSGLTVALPGFLGGLGLSNDGVSPNTVLDIASGAATADDGSIFIRLPSAYTKTTGAWAVGSGNGALDTGSIANSTWYHVFVIERTDTGIVDVLFSTSASLPTMPANYTKKRRVGSFLTDGSAHIIAFVQDGDVLRWSVPVNDVNVNNPGTSAVLRTLTVPVGVNVFADVVVGGENTVGGATPGAIYLSDPAVADSAPNGLLDTVFSLIITGHDTLFAAPAQIRTNTSAQIRSRVQISDANTNLYINTMGWTDRRGAR